MTKRYPVAIMSSDNHLQHRNWTSRPTLELDAMWAFDFMMEYAREAAIPNVILAGDVIDKQRNESEIAHFLREQMDFAAEHEINVWYTQGQHEMQTQPWLSSVHRWPEYLPERNVVTQIGPFKTWGIDWTPVDQLEERLAEVPAETELLVMHQVTQEWMGGICSAELDWAQVPYARMLLIGDYHGKHGRFERKGKQGQTMSVFCPGSQAMQAIDEPVQKRFFVLYDDMSTESINIPGRRVLAPPPLLTENDINIFVERVATQCQQAHEDAMADNLWREVQKPIVYAKFLNSVPDAYKRIAQAVGDRAFLFYKEMLPAPPENSPELEERKQVIEGGLLGALATVVPDAESELFQVSHRLLSERDVLVTLADLREEYLEVEDESA